MKRGLKLRACYEVRTYLGDFVGCWSSLSTARKHMKRGYYCIKYVRFDVFMKPVKYYLNNDAALS